MKTLDFPSKNHLTATDHARLVKVAKQNGQTPEEYVETVLKRAIFAPAPKKKGAEK